MIIAAAAVTAISLAGRGGPATSGSAPGASTATSTEAAAAAAWMHDQVSPDATVACDPLMCKALTRHGFPGRKLQLITPSSSYPNAQIVVETPVVRRQFGSSLAVAVAPEALASFGSGSHQVVIRIVAPSGAAAYRAQLAKDLQSRRVGGRALLLSRFVTATALARRQLLAGKVDTRLITVLFAIASREKVSILSFGPQTAGQSPGLPLRLAFLASYDQAAHVGQPDYVRTLQAALRGGPSTFRPSSARLESQHGKRVFYISFLAPSPLGLWNGAQP